MATPFQRYRTYREQCREEFCRYTEKLLEHDLVRQLDDHLQHHKYTRLRHCMDVAYISFFIARFLGWDSRSTARAGLLHDLFFHGEGQHSGSLLFSHPRIALENAKKVCALNDREQDIILKHMFLLTPWLPRYKESYLVTFVDKYCAAREFLVSPFLRQSVARADLSPRL